MNLAEFIRVLRSITLVVGALLLLVHAASAQGVEPSAVVDLYSRARVQQDVDAAVALFTDEASLRVERARPRTFHGKDEIRQFLQKTNLDDPAMLTPSSMQGDSVIWSERDVDPVTGAIDLSAQAQVENGKITSLTYRTGRLSVAQSGFLESSMAWPAGMTLGGIALFALGLLSLATVSSHRPPPSPLRGRLVAELGTWRSERRSL